MQIKITISGNQYSPFLFKTRPDDDFHLPDRIPAEYTVKKPDWGQITCKSLKYYSIEKMYRY